MDFEHMTNNEIESYIDSERHKAYNEGYDQGREDGYSLGYDDGAEEGYDKASYDFENE